MEHLEGDDVGTPRAAGHRRPASTPDGQRGDRAKMRGAWQPGMIAEALVDTAETLNLPTVPLTPPQQMAQIGFSASSSGGQVAQQPDVFQQLMQFCVTQQVQIQQTQLLLQQQSEMMAKMNDRADLRDQQLMEVLRVKGDAAILQAQSYAPTVDARTETRSNDVEMSRSEIRNESSSSGVRQNKKLSGDMLAKLRKVAASMRKKMAMYSRSLAHETKLEERMSLFKEGKTPPGVKPFALPYESAHWHSALGSDEQIIIHFTPQMTLAECREKLFFAHNLAAAEIDCKVEKARVAQLKQDTSFAAFKQSAEDLIEQENSDRDSVAASLRLEAPDSIWKIDGNAYRDVAEDMYRKLMQDSIKSNQTKEKSRQKQQMKEEAVALEVQKMSGQQVLQAWADKYMFDSFGMKPKGKGRGMIQNLDVGSLLEVSKDERPEVALKLIQDCNVKQGPGKGQKMSSSTKSIKGAGKTSRKASISMMKGAKNGMKGAGPGKGKGYKNSNITRRKGGKGAKGTDDAPRWTKSGNSNMKKGGGKSGKNSKNGMSPVGGRGWKKSGKGPATRESGLGAKGRWRPKNVINNVQFSRRW